MALDFLTIQPMSAECKRLFSLAKRIMTQQRLSLDTVMVSMCQVLRSWYQSGLVIAIDCSLVHGKSDGNKTRPWLESPLEEYDLDGDVYIA